MEILLGQSQQGGGVAAFLPFILIMFIIYFLMIRPQTKRQKEKEEMRNNIKKGDKIIYDRCPLDNLVYSLWAHEKGINDIDQKFIQKCIPVVRESLKFLDVIFFTPITNVSPIDIVDDGTRSVNKEHIEEIDHLFKGIEQQYFQNLKASPFLPSDDCPAIVEVFGNQQERIHLVRQYLDAEGDLMGDNSSSILDPEEIADMESILRDQEMEIAAEKARSDALFKHIQETKN